MKKIISLVLALLMSLNLCITAGAENILTETYTFIDSAYSPKLDMYVIMAKDLNTSDHKTQLYRSTDGVNWTACFSEVKAGINYASKNTRQLLVWWEDEGVFVAQVGGKAYVSENGVKWSIAENLNSSNGIIDTDGETLVIVADRTLKIAKNAEDATENIVVGTGRRYFKGVGLYPGEDKYFALDGSAWGGYTSTVRGSEQGLEIILKEKFNNSKFELPLDVIYVPEIGSWITINNNKADIAVITDEILEKGNTISYKTPKLSGGDNTEKLTGIGIGEKYIVIGTESGKMYYKTTEDVSDNSIIWEEITVGAEDEIRGITKSRDGYLLAISATETFILEETDNGVELKDTTVCSIKSSSERIEAPQNGTEDIEIKAIQLNYWNQAVTGLVTESKAAEGNEDVAASWNGKNIVFTVTSETEGKRAFTATDIYGKTHNFEVMFVKENDVDLEGYDTIALPDEGVDDIEVQYTPYILASDGEKMDRQASVELISAPDGVTFNPETNIVTASGDGDGGTLVLRVTSDGKPENTKDFEIAVTKRMPTAIEVTTTKEEILIPESGEIAFESSAVIYDQVRTEMTKEAVKWSLEGKTDGITIDEDTGEVIITAEAYSGELGVVATSVSDNSVSGKKTVKLTWTDNRCVKEELAAFDDNTITGENLPFMALSENGVKMEYTTSDEGVITSEGIITRNRQKDTYATVTIKAEKNDAKASKTINVTVLKEDNIAGVGDFEDKNTENINGEITTEANSGEYALKTSGKLQFSADVNKGSIYIFEAYVKADGDVSLSTGVGGKLAEITSNGKYKRIAGSYLYTKEDMEETVTISASGDWYVDDIKVYEMTLEYEELITAIAKAERSKKKADIDAARELLKDFPEVPLKEELEKRLDDIKTTGTSNGNISTGGGSGSGSGFISPSSTSTGTVGITGTTVNNDEKIYEYLLVFKDMSGHWAKDDVEYMANLGIVNGVDDTTFNPDASITRAEFAKLIVKTVGLTEVEYENTYYDIVAEDWYSGYVQAAKSAGYVSGYNGLFRPNDKITREEIAKVIVEAYNQKTNKTLSQGGALYFNDIEKISGWAYDYVVEATNEGFINGITEELFAPKQNATRAQAVVMLKRLYDKING